MMEPKTDIQTDKEFLYSTSKTIFKSWVESKVVFFSYFQISVSPIFGACGANFLILSGTP